MRFRRTPNPAETIEKQRRRDWRKRHRRLTLGAALNDAGLPGAIRAASIRDDASGDSLEIRVGVEFVRISVNGRDYFFDRISGAYDGMQHNLRSSAPHERADESALTHEDAARMLELPERAAIEITYAVDEELVPALGN